MPDSNPIVRLGVVQMAMGPDRKENLEKAVRMIEEASAKGADVVCLPELFSSTYFPQREDEAVRPEPIPGPTSRELSRAARSSKVFLVGGSIHEKAGTRRYNTSVVFDNRGRTLGKYRKVHVPYDSHFFEKGYFSSGSGYAVFNTPFGKIAPLICFDQWYPEPARICRLKGAKILFYPTAIGWVKGVEPTEGDWQEAWEAVQRGHSIANSVVVCAVNRVGVEDDMTFWGGSFVCDQFGRVLFRAGSTESVSVVEVDVSLGDDVEEGWGFLRNRKPSTYRRIAE
jgi:predicted amidohydrolase